MNPELLTHTDELPERRLRRGAAPPHRGPHGAVMTAPARRTVLHRSNSGFGYIVAVEGATLGFVKPTRTPLGRRCWEADCHAWPRGLPFRARTRRDAVALLLAAVAKKAVDTVAGAE